MVRLVAFVVSTLNTNCVMKR